MEIIKRRYLVVGATGNIGQYYVKRLIEDTDVAVVALCRNKEKAAAIFKNEMEQYGDRLIIEICDAREPIKTDYDFDYIINAAGICDNATQIQNPELVLDTNINITKSVCDLAREKRVKKLLHISSASVYGIMDKDYLTENEYGFLDFSDTRNCYGYSKRVSEMLCQSISAEVPVLMIRPFHILEVNMIRDKSTMLGYFLDCIWNKRDIKLKTDGTVKRNFTYINDLIQISLLLFREHEGVYNIGNPKGTYSVREMVFMLKDVMKDFGTDDINVYMNASEIDKVGNRHNLLPDLGHLFSADIDYSFAEVQNALVSILGKRESYER